MDYLIITLTKCKLYLTERELTTLLAMDPELWQQAIKRGKVIERSEKYKTRQTQRKGDTHC